MTVALFIIAGLAFIGVAGLYAIESHLGSIRRSLNDLADQGRIRAARDAYLDRVTVEAQRALEQERHR